MKDEIESIIEMIKDNTLMRSTIPVGNVGLLLPPTYRLNQTYMQQLWKRYRIFVMYADLYNRDVYRSAGMEFKDIYCINIHEDDFSVNYLRTRLRGPVTGLHFYKV